MDSILKLIEDHEEAGVETPILQITKTVGGLWSAAVVCAGNRHPTLLDREGDRFLYVMGPTVEDAIDGLNELCKVGE